jgi:hypothetical protein
MYTLIIVVVIGQMGQISIPIFSHLHFSMVVEIYHVCCNDAMQFVSKLQFRIGEEGREGGEGERREREREGKWEGGVLCYVWLGISSYY